MAFDGIVIANLTRDLKERLEGARITKIAQPEKDELLFTIKNFKDTCRVLMSASASLPLIYFTESNKPGPMTAPNFCMLLRKHIGSGRIVSVSQPGLERIIEFTIEHLDEMGDLRRKKLIVELMGKHSNIIFCRDDGVILDSIKHVSAQISSVREVLPGREYFIPQTVEKADPLTVTEEEFSRRLSAAPMPVQKALYSTLTGLSPIVALELCHLASIDADHSANELSGAELTHLYHTLALMMDDVREGRFAPNIVYRNDEPVEFASVPLTCYGCRYDTGSFDHFDDSVSSGTFALANRSHVSGCSAAADTAAAQEHGIRAESNSGYRAQIFASVSQLLETYYASRDTVVRIRQKSTDLRKIVQTALERNYKKLDLQEKQLRDTDKREKFKIYGELLNTYGYELAGGEKELNCLNYYTNEEIKIPLDPQLTARENSQKYFDRYNKLKRTCEALTEQTAATRAEIDHLESIATSLEIALKEEDLVQIKEELTEYGYIRRHNTGGKKPKITSRPFHYLSSDGFHIYVGKNNYQNEELTFKLASGNDWWFHAKGIPGSHVIVKAEGKELPDRVFEEAGALAAYYSKGRGNEKVEIDYIQKKHIRKVAGAAPGFVIYHTNYSLVAAPRADLKEIG